MYSQKFYHPTKNTINPETHNADFEKAVREVIINHDKGDFHSAIEVFLIENEFAYNIGSEFFTPNLDEFVSSQIKAYGAPEEIQDELSDFLIKDGFAECIGIIYNVYYY